MLNSVHYMKYIFGLAAPMTETTESERVCLRKHASGKRRLAEVGCFHGVNTKVFREVMRPDGVIIAIDPYFRCLFGIRGFGWARRIAHKEVGSVGNGSVVWVEDLGERAPSRSDVKALLPVDFLFIDGNHSYEYVKDDFNNWSKYCKKGAYIIFHDYSRHWPGVVKFIDECQNIDKIKCVKALYVARLK